jgi:protein-S-isoprenylcysteine O-methyltransferase Ste14
MTTGKDNSLIFLRWLQAVLLLPGTVLVAVPAVIVHFTAELSVWESVTSTDSGRFFVAVIVAIPGIVLAAWTNLLFIRFGDGTAAPWDPPQKFVVRGPYRHVRNPMISGVVFMLLAETILLQSTGLAIWTAVFFVGNSFYFPLVEERGLRKRFGADYDEYFRHVRRWIPRLTPWDFSATEAPERQNAGKDNQEEKK